MEILIDSINTTSAIDCFQKTVIIITKKVEP